METEEHIMMLKTVPSRLEGHALVANEAKCSFGVPDIIYLGYYIDGEGIHSMKEVKAILNIQWPKCFRATALPGIDHILLEVSPELVYDFPSHVYTAEEGSAVALVRVMWGCATGCKDAIGG